ncbi:hypothetical protein CCACVL1_00953, partial [Corchorus capsularis]
ASLFAKLDDTAFSFNQTRMTIRYLPDC